MKRLTLFTKKHCFLCEEAVYELEQLRQLRQFTLTQVDIEKFENRQFLKYHFDIPVLHFNDKLVMMHRIDKQKLLDLLK